VHTTVRGFTVVDQETYVRPGRGLPGLRLVKWKYKNYITDTVYATDMYIPM